MKGIKGETGTLINQLTMIQKAALLEHVRANYQNSGKTDADFAVLASQEVGFHVTPGNIAGMRKALVMKSERQRIVEERAIQEAERQRWLAEERRQQQQTPLTLDLDAPPDQSARIAALTKRCDELEQAVALLDTMMTKLLRDLGHEPPFKTIPAESVNH